MSRFIEFLTEMKVLPFDEVHKVRKGVYEFMVNDVTYHLKINGDTFFDDMKFWEVIFTINNGVDTIERPLDRISKYKVINKLLTCFIRLLKEDNPGNLYFHTKDDKLGFTYITLFTKFKDEMSEYKLVQKYLYDSMYFFLSNSPEDLQKINKKYKKPITEGKK